MTLGGVVLAAANWTAIGIVTALIGALAGPIIALYLARRTEKTSSFAVTMQAGVTSLVDQLQEEVHDCRGECARLRGECDDLRHQVEQLRRDVEKYLAVIDEREAMIIRLKRQAGSL